MKRKMMKMAAMMMAMTMVMGSAMTVHASEDGCVRDDGVGYGDSGLSCDIESGNSGDSGNSSSSESSSAPSESYDGGSSSYDDGCARDEGRWLRRQRTELRNRKRQWLQRILQRTRKKELLAPTLA